MSVVEELLYGAVEIQRKGRGGDAVVIGDLQILVHVRPGLREVLQVVPVDHVTGGGHPGDDEGGEANALLRRTRMRSSCSGHGPILNSLISGTTLVRM